MMPFAVVVMAMALGGPPVRGEPPQFSGDKTSWHGFDRFDLLMDESDLTVKP